MQPAEGGIYAIREGRLRWGYLKVLRCDSQTVHIAYYTQKSWLIPRTIEARKLGTGVMRNGKLGGIGHMPFTRAGFEAWPLNQIGFASVGKEELEGYQIWLDEEGGVFGERFGPEAALRALSGGA